ncbi:MAG TPA: hypothetical protein VNN09_01600 [Candidatus Competibacteraceae bacterium]|nr:hypothetical protein [Candidatus Competibacteraceae bacterium]
MTDHESPHVPERDLSKIVRPEIDYAAEKLRGAASTERTVTLRRSAAEPTTDQGLWVAIRNRTDAISFDRYDAFINRLLCEDPSTDLGEATCAPPGQASGYGSPSISGMRTDLSNRPNIYGPDAYYLLKLAGQAFLIFESGIVIQPPRNPGTGIPDPTQPVPGLETPESRLGRSVTLEEIQQELEAYLNTVVGTVGGRALPYLKRIVNALIPPDSREEKLPYCEAILRNRFSCPSLLELIWSYWQEEGMLVQTLNAIALRFQNRRSSPRDPLANLEIDPLRPLNNLLWGFIQDEYNRLSVPRRAYEYDHHYGLMLVGKAVPKLDSADSRSKFIEAYHNLLYRAAIFFREDADTTVIADAFPLLNTLKEVHLLLAEGAHNQFGDLPWTARAEMLNMQWLLARPEIREFLRGRHMVPYQEAWMGAVDDMKRLQGWTDTTVTHFHELAVTGERILLSVRYGDWSNINNTEDQAKNWARYWKPEIQRYIHAYQVVTGVDLTAEVTDTRRAAERHLQPSVHLQRRLTAQQAKALPAAASAARGTMASEVMGHPRLPASARSRLLKYDEDE